MSDHQQQIVQLPGGIQPHYCQLCLKLPVITQAGHRRTEKEHTYMKSWHKFNLQQVCQFANSGCLMFLLQLKELLQDEKGNSFLMNGHLQEICKAAYTKRLQLFYPLDPSRLPAELEDWVLDIDWSVEYLDFNWDTKSGLSHEIGVSRTIFTVEDSNLREFIENRPLRPKADLAMAKHWLQECLNDHGKCGQISDPHMPSRLIRVRSSYHNRLCLENIKATHFVSYAALSYCWGDAGRNNFKTEKETLSIREQGFDLVQLPKTLQDAVKVTRTLGLDYLWVDALCIVQDCKADQSKEIAKMWHIYHNATIVISAAKSSHADQGFLHQRDLRSSYLNTWAIPWHELNDNGNRVEDIAFCAEGDIRRVKVDPIDLRAWTLQEHKLASRILKFGSSQMIWWCAKGYKVDGGSNDEESPAEYSDIKEVKAFYEWKNIVEEFTTRSITKATDRLPALAAMAADYAEKHNIRPDQYIAGLWFPWLAMSSLWYIKDVHDQPTCQDAIKIKDRSPTWSWHLARSGISWHGISYQGDSDTFNLVITGCRVDLADDEVKYGRVERGVLKVDGELLKILLRGTRPLFTKPNGMELPVPIRIWWDSEDIPSKEELYCLKVRHMSRFVPEGIILKHNNETFHRVGYFQPGSGSGAPTANMWEYRKSIVIK